MLSGLENTIHIHRWKSSPPLNLLRLFPKYIIFFCQCIVLWYSYIYIWIPLFFKIKSYGDINFFLNQTRSQEPNTRECRLEKGILFVLCMHHFYFEFSLMSAKVLGPWGVCSNESGEDQCLKQSGPLMFLSQRSSAKLPCYFEILDWNGRESNLSQWVTSSH